jgi:4'-phosphopantetheinyl transferase
VLAKEHAGGDVRFNASHSDELALIAVVVGVDIGVDVERIDPRRADPGVAARFFAPAEVEALAGLSGRAWTRGFFDCWTRKEAFVKAVGEGLSYPLDGFEVSVSPDEPARIVRVGGSAALARRWSMAAMDPSPAHAGALVVAGPIGTLRCWHVRG